MKNLLLIAALLFSMSCMGQSWEIPDSMRLSDGTVVAVYDVYEISDSVYCEPITIDNFKESYDYWNYAALSSWFMDEYLAYCYSDSVEIDNPGYESCWIDSTGKWIYDWRYTLTVPHETPSFEGYATWLNNLLER